MTLEEVHAFLGTAGSDAHNKFYPDEGGKTGVISCASTAVPGMLPTPDRCFGADRKLLSSFANLTGIPTARAMFSFAQDRSGVLRVSEIDLWVYYQVSSDWQSPEVAYKTRYGRMLKCEEHFTRSLDTVDCELRGEDATAHLSFSGSTPLWTVHLVHRKLRRRFHDLRNRAHRAMGR